MSDPTQTQRERNLETRDDREPFAAHRAQVMRLVLDGRNGQTSADERLCVLGAGNGNDLDLGPLVECFSEVHLVDIDPDALAAATSNVPDAKADQVLTHQVDLTGWYDAVTSGPSQGDAAKSIHSATESYQPEISGSPFDVVVSTCLLSQLIESAITELGGEHPRLNECIFAIRHHHLRALLRLARPGGRVILVTDFVSSETLPQLASVSADQLPATIRDALENRNFFTGLNPGAIAQSLATEEQLAALATNVQISEPWRWNLGTRVFAVAAISFSSRAPVV